MPKAYNPQTLKRIEEGHLGTVTPEEEAAVAERFCFLPAPPDCSFGQYGLPGCGCWIRSHMCSLGPQASLNQTP